MATKVMLDIDGVLTVSWRALPGAVDTVRWLQAQEIGFRLVTNTSSKSRLHIAGLLAQTGMEVELEQVQTAVTSAARYLVDTYPGARCLFLNEGDVDEDLEGVEVVDAGRADVILLGGAGPSVGYDELDAAFKRAIDGVPVVALHRNTRFQTDTGPALDMGAFVVGLEAAASIEVTVVGKPAASFFEAALSGLDADPGSAVMVGDDLVSDVLGAQAVGITGVLVRTGKFLPTDLDQVTEEPDHIIDTVGDLPGLLEQLSDAGRPRQAGAGRIGP